VHLERDEGHMVSLCCLFLPDESVIFSGLPAEFIIERRGPVVSHQVLWPPFNRHALFQKMVHAKTHFASESQKEQGDNGNKSTGEGLLKHVPL